MATLGCVVPFDSEFRATTNVRKCKETASLDEKCHEYAELWRHGNAIASVRGHDGGMCASFENFATAHKEHRNLRPIFCPEPSLGMAEALGVKWNLPLCPERCLRLGGQIGAGLNGSREGLLLEEQLVTIFGAT